MLELGFWGNYSSPPILSQCMGPAHFPGGSAPEASTQEAEEDLTRSDDDCQEDHESALRKKLGIPEPDPDALPSSMIQKYLNLVYIGVYDCLCKS